MDVPALMYVWFSFLSYEAVCVCARAGVYMRVLCTSSSSCCEACCMSRSRKWGTATYADVPAAVASCFKFLKKTGGYCIALESC